MMELDLRVVRSFVTLATTLSFTRAAAALQVTQPQLSMRIRGLEGQLGFRLFERTSRQVRLTSQGEALLPQARRMLEEADRLLGEAENIRFNIGHTLKVGAIEYFQPLRRRFLSQYMKQHAAEVVEVEPLRDPSESLSGLASGRFDVAFLSCLETDALPAEFEGLVLTRQPLGLLVPAHSRLAGKPALDPADLAGLSVALFRRDQSPELHDQVLDVMSPLGVRIVRLPEPSEAGLLDFVCNRGMPAVCARWWTADEDHPVGVAHRLIRGFSLNFLCVLARLRSRAPPSGERLWRMARRTLAAQDVAAA
jgi:DNA-binding transcriptional LysR family regulator